VVAVSLDLFGDLVKIVIGYFVFIDLGRQVFIDLIQFRF